MERDVIPMEQADVIRMKEIMEMLNALTELNFDGYMKFKYAVLSQCKDSESEYFFAKLFEVAEKHRPKQIEMKRYIFHSMEG